MTQEVGGGGGGYLNEQEETSLIISADSISYPFIAVGYKS